MTKPSSPPLPPPPEDQRDKHVTELLAPARVDGKDLNIFTTLVRHPRLYKRWSSFGGFLLYRGELPARDRELLILRTAWNCRAEYEWGQHARIARTVDVSEEEISGVVVGPDAPQWSSFDAPLLRAADELHRESTLSDATWGALTERYDEHQMIEVCM